MAQDYVLQGCDAASPGIFFDVSKEPILLNMQDATIWAEVHDRVIDTDCSVTRCHIAEERKPQQEIASLEV